MAFRVDVNVLFETDVSGLIVRNKEKGVECETADKWIWYDKYETCEKCQIFILQAYEGSNEDMHEQLTKNENALPV